ncbi:hypothetical protein [Oceanobacillus indicireducens]|uniref:Uncharacterized protein n=1 Tax=Oceanobacillus indicireducens TaxID=1004261 RepID=A0A917Y6F9_9BACI|nr:hypothetical protein [Oceanobacillus indicireducens]GGN67668.1 hypothetical protein GCM10007971_38710 [Oceanobacillus indicireducens]
MKYLNHITLNSGDLRKSYSDEVDKETFFVLNRIYSESFSENGATFDDFHILKGTKLANGAIFTLLRKHEGGLVPILTTTALKRDVQDTWEHLHDTTTTPLKTDRNKPVSAPCVIDRLEAGAMYPQFMMALQWTGDLARILGWLALDPRKIR